MRIVSWLGFASLLSLTAVCVVRYHANYYRAQQSDLPGHLEAAAIVDHTTKPGDVIVITGLDRSSELPYHSHRRAIMDSGAVASHFPNSLGAIATAIQNQRAETIPAVVACDKARGSARTQSLLALVGIPNFTSLHADNCDIYLRPAR